MRKVITSLLLILLTSVFAQKYYVYSVSGKVSSSSKNVSPKQVLTESAQVLIDDGARIVLLCEAQKSMLTIKGANKGQLKELVKKASVKPVSEQYLVILMKKSSGTAANRDSHMQSAATSFRDLDSIPVSKTTTKDSIEQKQ